MDARHSQKKGICKRSYSKVQVLSQGQYLSPMLNLFFCLRAIYQVILRKKSSKLDVLPIE